MKKNASAEFNIEIEHLDTGAPVPVKFKVHYPKNHGLYLIKAITALHESAEEIASQMFNSGDASVIQALMKHDDTSGDER